MPKSGGASPPPHPRPPISGGPAVTTALANSLPLRYSGGGVPTYTSSICWWWWWLAWLRLWSINLGKVEKI